jgi:preprotein translocase subunit SecG
MSVLIGFLTVFLVLDCIFLVFLVLLQLPKKEAGVGVAFGGGATDALFGAGSGNMLTKITKWTAGLFFGLCLVLAVMTGHQTRNSATRSLAEDLGNNPNGKKSVPATGLLQTPTTSSNVAVPPPEATPIKPIPSAGPAGDNPPTAPTPSTGSKTSPTSPTPK